MRAGSRVQQVASSPCPAAALADAASQPTVCFTVVTVLSSGHKASISWFTFTYCRHAHCLLQLMQLAAFLPLIRRPATPCCHQRQRPALGRPRPLKGQGVLPRPHLAIVRS